MNVSIKREQRGLVPSAEREKSRLQANRLLSIALVCLLQVSLAVASTFDLSVEVTPVGSGTLNTSGGTYEEGSDIYLWTYGNTGYVFKGWYEGEKLLSSSTSFNYIMPSEDVTVQARYEYDPAVPGNPAMPDTTTYYLFTAQISPIGAGFLNTVSGRYAAGATVNLHAYTNTGYQFVGWQNEAGEALSSSASYSYTMPRHDSQLTALYLYDPTVPANPDSMATRYTVTVECKPMGGGTFNTTSTTAEEGGNVHLYAYTNTGYRFLHWENEQGETISTAQNFYYVIPHGNSKVYGIFEYDPAVPGNPNRNYWNKELGEVIVDDFVSGSLDNAVSEAISGSSRDDVAMITVAGVMNDNDFGIANNYTNCTLLDLSRVTGITQVPSYAFDYTNLESVLLPVTIEKVGYRAFYECKQLSALTIYAITPPVLEDQAFDNVPEGLIVYVPASSIAQYQEAEGWKNFTILPIQEDIRSLSISLPEDVNVSDYAQMWLELANTKSGQRMHYVMTDRTQYTFTNIIRNTSWNVTLRNERGDIFGQIDNVEVKDEDVSIVFTSLSKPRSVLLTILTPDGKDVTDQTQITWTDAQGDYLAQGVSLMGLPAGYQTSYRIVLSQELAMTYATPQQTDYVLTDGDNNVTCQLSTIPRVQISGKVKDKATSLPVSGATISISQTFGGKYSKTLNTKTDDNGVFTLDVANVPTSVAFSASDYVSQTINCDSLLTGVEEVTLPDVSLKSITGATITLNFTFTSCEGETQSMYSDYQNVSYELFNVTKNKAVSQYNVQYPQIVLLEEVADGDVLRLTANSRTNAFVPVIATATIVEQKAQATFAIVELGKIQSSFTSTGNAAVVGTLYDAAGKLLKTYNYSEASLTISDLADGQYTLISMGNSRLFNTIYDLAQLPQTGLMEGTDYVKNSVEVKSGAVSIIKISEVPTLDESKLYYTGDNTSFTVNKPSIVAGNYLTLTGRIDFKPAYATSVSNVQMIVDLPESCEFVENSVMVGNSTSSYTLNGHQITIPMTRYTDRVRFCIIPTLGGEYAPSAFAQFDLNGETVTQPIGSANYTAKDLSISVPSTVAKTTITITGTAIGTSVIDIYDNGVLIGQTTSLANGLWTASCELADAYNLSSHNIQARVTTKSGLILHSETMSCIYDKNAIQVSTVTMINTAHTSANLDLHDYVTVFDFQKPPTSIPAYWYWPSYPDFTFIVDFTNNDSTIVSDVVLYVFCDDGKVVPLYPTYDSKQDKWVAKEKFDSFSLPTNVSVDFTCDTKTYLDAQKIVHAGDDFVEVSTKYFEAIKKLRELLSASPDLSEEDYQQLCNIMEIDYDNPDSLDYEDVDFTGWTQDQIDAYLDSRAQEMRAELDIMIEQTELYDNWFEMPKQLEQVFGDGATYSISDCSGLSAEQLVADGYVAIETTEGGFIYMLTTEYEVTLVLFEENLRISVRLSQVAATRLRDIMRAPLPDKFSEVYGWIAQARELVNTIYQDFLRRMMIPEQLLSDQIGKLQKYIAQCERYLSMCNHGSQRWKYWNQMIKDTKVTLATTRTVLRFARPLLRFLTRCIPIADYLVTLNDCYATSEELAGIYASIPEPCPDDQSNANWCKAEDIGILLVVGGMAISDVVAEITGDVEIITGAAGSVATGGASLAVTGWGLVKKIAAQVGKCCVNLLAQKVGIKHLRNKVNNLKCKKPEPPKPPLPPCPNVPNVKDPSGYVYEGVSSNRVEGVTATAYYKEMMEDMYGDLHENIIKWDASEYAQENPLFTDEYGMYAWDVPNGLWQVKFEKEGYETTYSEWLPVPPPQLDINIPMKQNVQPNVKAARAYEDAVELEFDKYMIPELLTAENIMVMQNGTAVEGTIELLNEEASYEGEAETFASKVRFNAATPFTEQEITLIVNNRVKSYAGIRMQDNYEQKFAVEQEIKQIVSDSVVTVGYGKTSTLVVSVLPVSASKGKTLTVRTSSPMILGVKTEQVTIGNDGKAEITVSGELPGTAALTFSVEGIDKTAVTIANVEQVAIKTVATPKASIASGTVVEKGTTITLSCETEGATIYYTLDGSCPCNETDARKIYDGTPIVINETVTIKAMAVNPDMYESEVAEFSYIVEGTGIDDVTINGQIQIYPLPVCDEVNISAGGKTIKNVAVSSMNGIVVASTGKPATKVTLDVSRIPMGIYIINVTTIDSSFSRKILKVK